MGQVGYTLTLHNELESAKVNDQIKRLTQSTVDDSATVKTITIVSAIYLPGSFVGVSLSQT